MTGREVETLFDHVRCRIGRHRWPQNATTTWLHAPTPYHNAYGTAMEYRACERCGKLGDVSAWLDVPDPDYGFPKSMGPFTGRRMLEVTAGPRTPLPAEPLPWEADGTVKP